MSTIVTRAGKGSALTHNEVDGNFTNLNSDKYQTGGALGTPASGNLTNCTFPATVLETADIGVLVQAYDTDLTAWAGVSTAAKQDTLVSATNIKTINGSSVLGAGNLVVNATVSDGDKGDITVSASGATFTIDNNVVGTAKLGGDITTAGKALLDDADATAQRATLGLGTSATTASTAYATAAQGATANTALQSASIGVTVQAYDSNLTSFVGVFTLPTADGTINQVLKTDGAGNIGFATPSSSGTVTSVSALTLGTSGTDLSSSVTNSTTTPVITLNVPTASASNRGVLSVADWSTFNGKGNGTVTSVTGTAPVVSSGGATPAISMAAATTSVNGYLTSTDWTTFNNKGSGTVTSVSWTGGIVSVATATTIPAFTIAGTSGGIPYFSSSTTWATSAALAANALVIGGGAGVAPSTTTTGTGVVTALGIAANSGTGGLVTNTGIATLTNKTLTTPIISSISNTGTVTLPTSTDTLVGRATTDTLTNKRVTARVSTTASNATPTINTDNVDVFGLTAQTVDITSFTTNLSGTPTDGQRLLIYIVGTAARAITFGASFEASTIALPTTTVTTNRLDVGFIWNAATSKWRCVATA